MAPLHLPLSALLGLTLAVSACAPRSNAHTGAACAGQHGEATPSTECPVEAPGDARAPALTPYAPRLPAPRAEPEQRAHGRLLPIIEDRWLVLGVSDPNWGEGAPQLASARGGLMVAATRRIGESQLSAVAHHLARSEHSPSHAGAPPKLPANGTAKAALSEPLGYAEVFHEDGSSREVPLSGLVVLRRIYDMEEASSPPSAPSDAALAQLAWSQSHDPGLVVVDLCATAPCGALVAAAQRAAQPTARSATTPPMSSVTPTNAPSYGRLLTQPSQAQALEVLAQLTPAPDDKRAFALAARALELLQGTPNYRAHQARYARYLRAQTPPDPSAAASWEHHSELKPELRFWGSGEPRYIGWSLLASEGCGDFDATLTGVFEVLPGGRLRTVELREARELPTHVIIGDGATLWDSDGLRLPGSETPYLSLAVSTPICRC
ncbi:MAG: hypothetical protein KIT72_03205 [Polyangiaceae bacterium]|nr:hypothetical protein [Polyangiaceae bacterium]MCW5789408.1 hypothetical protein [Polyangiaceae bacterium]